MEQNPRISEKLHVRIPGKEEDKRVRKNFAYIEKASSSQPDVVVDRVVFGIIVKIRQNQDNIGRRQSRRQDRRQNSSESRQRPPTRTVQIWTKK